MRNWRLSEGLKRWCSAKLPPCSRASTPASLLCCFSKRIHLKKGQEMENTFNKRVAWFVYFCSPKQNSEKGALISGIKMKWNVLTRCVPHKTCFCSEGHMVKNALTPSWSENYMGHVGTAKYAMQIHHPYPNSPFKDYWDSRLHRPSSTNIQNVRSGDTKRLVSHIMCDRYGLACLGGAGLLLGTKSYL